VAGTTRIAILVVAALVVAACTSSTSEVTTTTAVEAPVTTLATEASTTTSAPETTTVPQVTQISPPQYKIMDRIEGDDGDTVVVLLDASSYDSLTDLDLFDIIVEVVELFPPISTIHIVDDPAAVSVVVNPDASNAEIEAIQENYLARLDNGFTITYLGPFAARGTAILGS